MARSVPQLLLLIEQKQKWEKRQPTELSGTNQLVAGPVCDHCTGVTSHESWCITCNAIVRYAYAAVMDGSRLTLGDELSLHALGVEWTAEASKAEIRRL